MWRDYMSKFLREYVINGEHHRYRRDCAELLGLAEKFKEMKLSPKERMTRRFEIISSLEEPHLLPNEKICFIRTVKKIPDCFTEDEWKEIKSKHFIHETGYLSNLTPNYGKAIKFGLLELKKQADEYGARIIDSVISLADRYRKKAEEEENYELTDILKQIPRYGARNFREALQFFRILHYSLWLEGNYHNTIGRFDVYMYPYFKSDMEKGVYTEDTALELLEDFFISFNKDSDLYIGVQQGDNGQSMVLGGIDLDGNDVFNKLSEMCLKASENLMMIDPKINLRVSKNTPLHIYELGSRLTKVGLGFPQYSNDDIVIQGLTDLGYDKNDAVNYSIAACWEYIIPNCGGDVANIGALSLPKAVVDCMNKHLLSSSDFDSFMEKIKTEIQEKCDEICNNIVDLWFVPSPFMNVLVDGGIYDGAKYNNFGIHGTGIATAADSLAAIEKYVFTDKTISASQLTEAVNSDFELYGELLPKLRYESPKMGNNDDSADKHAVMLLEYFADSLKGKKNCRGGCYRAGTGSAMYYLWHADEIGATPDGRRAGEPFGANFSPSIFAKINGPVSVIKSFTKPGLKKTINGGPLTLEFASSMFNDRDSITKIASLIKAYISMGGHQLQLNSVNSEVMLDAQKNPELHRQLVVRIWGWSAYFVELDKCYQDHVIKRQQYSL